MKHRRRDDVRVDVTEYDQWWWEVYQIKHDDRMTDPLYVGAVAYFIIALCMLGGKCWRWQWDTKTDRRQCVMIFSDPGHDRETALRINERKRHWYETNGYHHPSVQRFEMS